MFEWRVTKYGPQFRENNGAYIRNEWTSVSDIGHKFNDEIFEQTKYLKMEDLYVSIAMLFFQEIGLPFLTILELEIVDNIPPEIEKLGLANISHSYSSFVNGQQLTSSEIEAVCRLNLRELIWCKLEEPGKFFIHFGYDYYMYIGSILPSIKPIESAQKNGLFVEEKLSPYR